MNNFSYLTDLTGNVLRTDSADAGITLALSDAAGRLALAVSATGVIRTVLYEDTLLPGRMLSVMEQTSQGPARISERFVYAGHSPAEKNRNLAGQCVRHYDTAGRVQLNCLALSGKVLSQSRQLLTDATEADWQGAGESAWNNTLSARVFVTQTTADATGAVLTTTDAAGHLQRVAYNIGGQLKGTWLTLTGGTEQPIVRSLTYSAAGQKLREEHGNGVVTTYTYELQTQRLVAIKTGRPVGHAAGEKVLQDLRYNYDPVGNVLKVKNDAEATQFWRNQKVVPENTYTYDSLYQLVSATGREMASAGQQGSHLPAVAAFDNATLTNYSRTYRYDNGGNLTQISHSAPASGNNHTTTMTVSHRSNRAVLSSLTTDPMQVDVVFTAGGQQKQLMPGQQLSWNTRGELVTLTPSTGSRESYRYDSSGQRLVKANTQKTGHSTQTQRVIYLPGLELRITAHGGTQTENLQVITAGEAGRAQVRALHWESGKPAAARNNQLRYSYDNLIGSSGLEVDGSGNLITEEEYYPYGGTAVWSARSALEADYKTIRYSGKERDATGLYYYGYRYYQPWAGRWLSADPAGTVDGLNLYRMCRNNPVTLRDVDGRAPGDKFYNFPIVAEGLSNFEPAEKRMVLESLQTAHESLNTALQHTEEPSLAMKTYFGDEYQQYKNSIVDTWTRTKGLLAEYMKPSIGDGKFYKATGSEHGIAAIDPYSDTGLVVILDAFSSDKVTSTNRAAVLIHEFSHLSEISGINIRGADTQDFFYLAKGDGAEGVRSQSILNEVGLEINRVVDFRAFFNEVAIFQNKPIISIRKDVMSYGDIIAPEMLTKSDAVEFFNQTPLFRSHIASKNADSIAYAALHIKDMLLSSPQINSQNTRGNVARNTCCTIS